MIELYAGLLQERKEKIQKQIDFYFSMFEDSPELPNLLNNYVNTFSNELEADFADFYINLKFIQNQGEHNE